MSGSIWRPLTSCQSPPAERTDGFRLMGREDGERRSGLRHQIEGFQIDRGFGQPHAFGQTAEAADEIFEAPADLGLLVAAVGERHDHVVIGLRHGRSVAGELFLALPVGVDEAAISVGRVFGRPGEQRRAEVEADFGIVVDDARDALLVVENAGGQIGRVAFGGDALIPIVIRISGILQFDLLKPWILARRLIEMAMNTKISLTSH